MKQIADWSCLSWLESALLLLCTCTFREFHGSQSYNYVLTKTKCIALNSFLRQHMIYVFGTLLCITSYFQPMNEKYFTPVHLSLHVHNYFSHSCLNLSVKQKHWVLLPAPGKTTTPNTRILWKGKGLFFQKLHRIKIMAEFFY